MKRILTIILTTVLMLSFTFSANATILNQITEVETLAIREIPEGAILIQTGLYLKETPVTINGTLYTYRELYSAEGYCFYNKNDEIYDEEGNLIAPEDVTPEMRTYAQYASLSGVYTTIEQINAVYVSVPVQDGYEIVSVPNNTETM